jgi:hypothetical protein
MELPACGDAAIAPSPPAKGAPAAPVGKPARIVVLDDRRKPTTHPCDDLRQLAVVVWARTQLVERLLAAQGPADPRLLAGLADIDAAVAAIGARLDALEDALPRRAA